MFEVFELDRAGAGAENVAESDAAGLMAVVTAIVDVIRAVDAREEL